MFIQRTVEKCKYGEMQESQEYTQTQVSEKRRQRVSQATKRYNCYIEKNIVIFMFKYLRYTV